MLAVSRLHLIDKDGVPFAVPQSLRKKWKSAN